MNAIEYLIHFFMYQFIASVLTGLVCAPAVALILLFEFLRIEIGVVLARVIAVPFLAAVFLVPPLIAHKATCHRLESSSAGLYGSFRVGWAEARAELSFLPLVGRLFSYKWDRW